MKFLTFDQIKAQLRLDDQQATDEHDLLVLYGEAAEDVVLDLIRRPLYNVMQVYGHVPKRLMQASLLIVAQSYQHREPASSQNLSVIPYSLDMLLKPFMRLDGEELPLDPVLLYVADYYGKRLVSSNGKYIVTQHQFEQ